MLVNILTNNLIVSVTIFSTVGYNSFRFSFAHQLYFDIFKTHLRSAENKTSLATRYPGLEMTTFLKPLFSASLYNLSPFIMNFIVLFTCTCVQSVLLATETSFFLRALNVSERVLLQWQDLSLLEKRLPPLQKCPQPHPSALSSALDAAKWSTRPPRTAYLFTLLLLVLAEDNQSHTIICVSYLDNILAYLIHSECYRCEWCLKLCSLLRCGVFISILRLWCNKSSNTSFLPYCNLQGKQIILKEQKV